MDLSVASLFGYRKGSIQISTKGWRKLEQAERVAGIDLKAENAEYSADPKDQAIKDSAHCVREDPAVYHTRPPELTAERNWDRVDAALERIADALEELARKSRNEKP